MSDELTESRLRKLKLEIALLEWRNSRFGRLTRLTAVFTVIVTVITVFATLLGWGWDRFRERQLRAQELSERLENQYRSNIQQLLRYPKDENQTIPSVIFVFDDISNLLQHYSPEELANRRLMIGTWLAELRTSSEFDLGESRNVEFDYAVLKFCSYCSEAVVKNPRYLKIMLEKYSVALAPFHQDDDKFKSVYKIPGTDSFNVFRTLESIEKQGFTIKLRPFATMVRAYELHLALLNKSIQENPKDDALKVALNRYTCDFFLATQNPTLTKNIFNVNDDEMNARMAKCIQ